MEQFRNYRILSNNNRYTPQIGVTKYNYKLLWFKIGAYLEWTNLSESLSESVNSISDADDIIKNYESKFMKDETSIIYRSQPYVRFMIRKSKIKRPVFTVPEDINIYMEEITRKVSQTQR